MFIGSPIHIYVHIYTYIHIFCYICLILIQRDKQYIYIYMYVQMMRRFEYILLHIYIYICTIDLSNSQKNKNRIRHFVAKFGQPLFYLVEKGTWSVFKWKWGYKMKGEWGPILICLLSIVFGLILVPLWAMLSMLINWQNIYMQL